MTDPYTILRAFVAAYHGDPIADSDLDDEQPRTITVTLGDIRRAQAAAYERELWARDMRRMDWLSENLLAADFEYEGSDTKCVLIIQWPRNVGVGGSLRQNVDAAITEAEYA